MSKVRFTAETIKSGQPRPYADTEREYVVTVEREVQRWMQHDKYKGTKVGEWIPWLYPEGTDDNGKKWFQNWCDMVVKATCQNFYRKMDDPGACWASPILKWMRIDHEKGTIRVFITEAYTD